MDKSFLIFLAIPIFFVMILIEYIYGKLKGKNNYRLNDTITSINIGLLSRFPTILNLGVQGLVYAYVASYLSLNILPENSIFTWVFAFVLYDFLYYWMHRLHHENKLLWGTHVVHHHGEEFNLSTAMRQTSTGFLWKWIFYLPMVILGVPPLIFVAVGGLNLIYQYWVHTEHIGKLGWYEKIFITPSNHRIHHAKNPEYIDANYGGVFILWDRFFGTYIEEKDEIKPVYGTVKPLRSWNPLWANIEVFSGMVRDSFYTKHWKDKIKVWFSSTKWRPADMIERFPPKDIKFEEKFDPKLDSALKPFLFTQIFIMPVFAMIVFLTVSQQTYTETAFFGASILISSSIIGITLNNNFSVLYVEIFRALGVLILIYLFGFADETLLPSIVMTMHALINLVVSFGILFSYQRRLLIKPINN